MSRTTMKTKIVVCRLIALLSASAALLFALPVRGAVPGITGPTFSLSAEAAYISQPDGAMIYSGGYGCQSTPANFAPSGIAGATCSTMQIPGPTLIVSEGAIVT